MKMRTKQQWMILGMVCIPIVLFLASGAGNAAEESRLLWQIGKSDNNNAEFALAPDQYKRFSADGFFIVGRSDSARDWPYVHPGPDDAWAGSRSHTFSIVFGVKEQPDGGQCRLLFDLLDTQALAPPRLKVQVNGHEFEKSLPAGAGDASVFGQPDKGKECTFAIDFPASFLKSGENLIAIETRSGSWFLYDCLGLETPAGVEPAAIDSSTFIENCRSIRAVLEKNGKRFQPIQLSIRHLGKAAAAVLRIPGADSTAIRLEEGNRLYEAVVPAVMQETTFEVSLECEGRTLAVRPVSVKPVRKMIVYIVPHSHTDIGYTEIQTAIEEKQMKNLQTGIEYARKTADYPEGARFIWNVEVPWAVDLYLQRMPEAQRAEFFEAVKKGWVGLNGMYLNELTGLCRPEELLQLFRYSTQLAERCGVTIDSAMISDVPGYTWGTVTAMAKAGIKYFSTAPNYFDRIGDILAQWENKPFYWVSPSGNEKVLVWIPLKGYALSHIIGRLSSEFVDDYQKQLESMQYPYDIAYLRWSGHGDNAVPDMTICEFIKEWNSKYVFPKFIITTTSDAFSAFEKKYGDQIPKIRGDWTPYWEDGAGSSALETAMNRASSDRISQAETLWAMLNPSRFPAADFENAWRNVLLYSEHTWGAWCSVSDPENKMTREQWEIKQSYALQADAETRRLLNSALENRGESESLKNQIDVFNTASWPRTDLVVLSNDLSSAGDRVTDNRGKPVPSQRLTTGELAFLVCDIPPFAARRYTVLAGDAYTDRKASAQGAVLENGLLRLRVDEKTGGIVDLGVKDLENNFVDTASGYAMNDYLYLPGNKLADLQRNGAVKISVKENGPLVASLSVESDAPGCNSLKRELRMIAGFDYVELIDAVDKKRAAISSKPGDWEFAQKGGKESVNFAFPFNVPKGVMRLEVPLGVIQPEIDQMPSACKNWFTVGRWADVSNDEIGITWATLDAPLVEVGELSAILVGSQNNPNAWRKHVEPTRTLFSWAMNNHWGTNYRAYQDGLITFRYALRLHRQFHPDTATRFAADLSQPLIAARAARELPDVPLLRIEPEGAIVTGLKISGDGKAWIVQLYGASGKDLRVKLTWSKPEPNSVWLSDTSEKPIQKAGNEIALPAWDVVTLRAELPERSGEK